MLCKRSCSKSTFDNYKSNISNEIDHNSPAVTGPAVTGLSMDSSPEPSIFGNEMMSVMAKMMAGAVAQHLASQSNIRCVSFSTCLFEHTCFHCHEKPCACFHFSNVQFPKTFFHGKLSFILP